MNTVIACESDPNKGAAATARAQTGFTLIELMVGMALSLLIAGAAVAALLIARQGFTSVDASSQLRENSRFAADVLQRIIVQAGFEDITGGQMTRMPNDPKDPGIEGFDNAWVTLASLPTVTTDSRTAGACGAGDTSCLNGSDVLIVRYWGTSNPTGTAADGAMINCAGIPEPLRAERAYSIFHVTRGADGEPTLACTYRDPASGAWRTEPLVKGVEAFQVLYGVDNVTPNAAPPAGSVGMDGVTDRFLTARQMVAPIASDTQNNWRRVRSLRIGLLMRGDLGSAPNRIVETMDVLGLGAGITIPGDVNAKLTVPADGRLRYRLDMTIHMRNQQGFDVQLGY